jgi:dihydroorotate dehydrogenase (NAD+) catalytic subunit
MGDSSIELFGTRLKNPIMNASGTLGYGREIEPLWDVGILGAFVTKGLSLRPYRGNTPPRVREGRGFLLNRIGLQNVGLQRFLEEHVPFFKQKGIPIMVNFFGSTEEEYVAFAAAIIEDPIFFALEMNVSCPNVDSSGLSFGRDATSIARLTKAVKAASRLPVVVKLSPAVKDLLEAAIAAEEAGADGITVFNTIPSCEIEEGRLLSFGLSGPPLKPVTLRAVSELSRAVKIPIIGAGGIMDLEDALSFLLAGARAVQVGTATFVDPYTIPRIIRGLSAYLEERRIDVTELGGRLHGDS